MNIYADCQYQTSKIKDYLLEVLLNIKKHKKVTIYETIVKGNTLLNYTRIKSCLTKFAIDKSPHEQGKYLLSSHVPIINEGKIKKYTLNYILISPWNIKNKTINQFDYAREWNCMFILVKIIK